MTGDPEVDFSVKLQNSWVLGLQPEERLCHRAEDLQYCISCDRLTTGGYETVVVLVAKDLEERDRVDVIAQVGIDGGFEAKSLPDFPMCIL